MHIEKKGMSHEKRQYIKPLASHENKIIGKCYSLYVVWYGYNILSITSYSNLDLCLQIPLVILNKSISFKSPGNHSYDFRK